MPSSSAMYTPTASAPNTATIEYRFGQSTMFGTNDLQWASHEDILEFAGYRIEHPMTYWSSGKPHINDASCIDKQLPVSESRFETEQIFEPKGALGYWPRYESMSPSQRGNYLRWLALGKREHLNDIGYAFVYFYGLERRALIDGKDVDLILSEVLRLRSLKLLFFS